MKIDLNSDLGESFGAYSIGNDEEILKYVSSANIACGFHAGDPMVMAKTVRLAKEKNVSVGAHPGFPDLAGFGRRNMACSPEDVKEYVRYQIGALMAYTVSNGLRPAHVKPHGALYNMAAKDLTLALAIAEAIAEIDQNIILLGLAGSKLIEAGRKTGLRVAGEVFADRAYEADGTLVPRNVPGAVIHDGKTAIERVIRMISDGKVQAITGENIKIEAHSICVHGDNPAAISFVSSICNEFAKSGIVISPLTNIV